MYISPFSIVSVTVVDGGDKDASVVVGYVNDSKDKSIFVFTPQIYIENWEVPGNQKKDKVELLPSQSVLINCYITPTLIYTSDRQVRTSNMIQDVLAGKDSIVVKVAVQDDEGRWFSNVSKWGYHNGSPGCEGPLVTIPEPDEPDFIKINQLQK